MAQLPRHPGGDSAGPDPEPSARTPVRVYVIGILAAIVVAVFVVLHLTGVIGPGTHEPGGGSPTPSSIVTVPGRQQP